MSMEVGACLGKPWEAYLTSAEVHAKNQPQSIPHERGDRRLNKAIGILVLARDFTARIAIVTIECRDQPEAMREYMVDRYLFSDGWREW